MPIQSNKIIPQISSLCEKIKLAKEAEQRVIKLLSEFDFEPYSENIQKLCDTKTAKESYDLLCAAIDQNPDKGYIWLCFYLLAALETKKRYAQKGIDEEIFYASIAVLSRCVNEHKESFGCYGYDRAFWNYRQVSMSIFRIGVLEYELHKYDGEDAVMNGETLIKNGDHVLSIHIPSDAPIKPDLCKASLTAAKDFFLKYYPEFEYKVFYCSSWIISPNLKQVLPETSNIIAFINMFEIYKTDEDNEGYKTWVFKNNSLEIDEFPQNTSLQRNIVAHLKRGGKIGAAWGIIRKENI